MLNRIVVERCDRISDYGAISITDSVVAMSIEWCIIATAGIRGSGGKANGRSFCK